LCGLVFLLIFDAKSHIDRYLMHTNVDQYSIEMWISKSLRLLESEVFD
jgi:hypothetical protein